MEPLTLRLPSLAVTRALGKQLGQRLQDGDEVGLVGPLGAGKTALVRGLAAGLGLDEDEVTSPTYSLVQTYRGGRLVLHHADAYRLAFEGELRATGLFDVLDEGGVLALEWADRFPGALGGQALWVRLEVAGEGERRARLWGGRPELLEGLAAPGA